VGASYRRIRRRVDPTLVGQADLLMLIKAHATLSTWPAKVNLVETISARLK
jgi:hypothetical protein